MADRAPEPCLGTRCWSPVACGGFGYCRLRNEGMMPTDEEVARRRAAALRARTHETGDDHG